MHSLAGNFATVFLSVLLYHLGQLLLQPARQVDAEIPLQHVGHAPLAGLGINAHHFFVAAPHIRRIDRQIGHVPDIAFLIPGQAFANGILMAAGEGAEHQIPCVGMARVCLDVGNLFHQRDDFLHSREVDLRVDPLAVQVHTGGHQIHVAGAFTVTQQGAFHPVSASHHRHFSRSHTAAPVIVGMHADDHIIAVLNLFVDQLHLISKHIGGAHLDSGRQVDDHPLALVRAPYRVHRIDHFDGEIGLGGTEGFRGILEAPVGIGLLRGEVTHPFGRPHGNGLAACLVHIEHLLTEGGRGGIVDMHDGVFCTLQRFKGPRDQVFPGLGQYLNVHVIGHQILFDQGTAKVEIDLAGRWEAHLDFLEAQLHQHLEEGAFLSHGHGLDQRLVTVTQVHRRPQGGFLDPLARPTSVGLVDNRKWLVFGVIKAHVESSK